MFWSSFRCRPRPRSLEKNIVEAEAVITTELGKYRDRSYRELCALIDEPLHCDVTGPSGVRYQVEISAVWDSAPHGDVHVFGSIDDGGWRAFCPLTKSFIKAPDGRFVGEDPL